MDYSIAEFSCIMEDGQFRTYDETTPASQKNDYANMWQIAFVPLEDYNQMMNQKETLAPGEALIYTTKRDYEKDTIVINDGEVIRVKKVVPEFIHSGIDGEQLISFMYIFVPNLVEAACADTDIRQRKSLLLIRLQDAVLQDCAPGLRGFPQGGFR